MSERIAEGNHMSKVVSRKPHVFTLKLGEEPRCELLEAMANPTIEAGDIENFERWKTGAADVPETRKESA
jgi:hypothetical protein